MAKKFSIAEFGRKIQAEARKIKRLHKNIKHTQAVKLAAKKLKKK